MLLEPQPKQTWLEFQQGALYQRWWYDLLDEMTKRVYKLWDTKEDMQPEYKTLFALCVEHEIDYDTSQKEIGRRLIKKLDGELTI